MKSTKPSTTYDTALRMARGYRPRAPEPLALVMTTLVGRHRALLKKGLKPLVGVKPKKLAYKLDLSLKQVRWSLELLRKKELIIFVRKHRTKQGGFGRSLYDVSALAMWFPTTPAIDRSAFLERFAPKTRSPEHAASEKPDRSEEPTLPFDRAADKADYAAYLEDCAAAEANGGTTTAAGAFPKLETVVLETPVHVQEHAAVGEEAVAPVDPVSGLVPAVAVAAGPAEPTGTLVAPAALLDMVDPATPGWTLRRWLESELLDEMRTMKMISGGSTAKLMDAARRFAQKFACSLTQDQLQAVAVPGRAVSTMAYLLVKEHGGPSLHKLKGTTATPGGHAVAA